MSCQCSTLPPTRPGASRRCGEAMLSRASLPAAAMNSFTLTTGTPGSGVRSCVSGKRACKWSRARSRG
eukprot:8298098-Lingulodinium_polyedra.AAC.1